jgi:hypothetical protein
MEDSKGVEVVLVSSSTIDGKKDGKGTFVQDGVY